MADAHVAPVADPEDPVYGNVDPDTAQEWFSRAYIQAVASAARCTTMEPRPDAHKVDLAVQHECEENGGLAFAQLDLQIRSSGQDIVRDDHVAIQIEQTLYARLIAPERRVPLLLVVVAVPSDFKEWIDQTHDRLLMKKCAYWQSFLGQPPNNAAKPTVHLPRSQIFDVRSLCDLMRRVRQREPLVDTREAGVGS